MPSNGTDTKYGSALLGKMVEGIRKKRKIWTTEAFDVPAILQAAICSEAEFTSASSDVIFFG